MELENTTHQGIALNRKIVQISTVVGTVATLLLGIWIYRTGFFEAEGSLKALLAGMGIYAPVIFLLIQIIQVVYPIIPGGSNGRGGSYWCSVRCGDSHTVSSAY